MVNRTNNSGLYKWDKTDSKQTTITEMAANMDIIDLSLAESTSQFENDDFFANDILLIPTYMGFLNPVGQLELYVSNDAKTFKNVNRETMFKSSHGNIWDYSLMYHNGFYWLLYDYTTGIGVAKTTDFVSFTEYDITIPSQYTQQWAPEWFKDDNGDVYIFISLGTGTTTTDIDGATIQYLENYYIKATDSTLQTYSSPVKMVFPDSTHHIDPFITKKDGLYHLFIKNEYNKTIEHLTNTVINGATTWTFNQTISFPLRAEAPCVFYFQGLYYLYVDAYMDGNTMAKTSTDLVTWSDSFKVGSPVPTRHFTPIVISDATQKKSIQNLMISKNKSSVININSNLLKNEKNPISLLNRVNLTNLATGGVISTLKVEEGTVYFVNGINFITINNIDHSTLQNNKPIYFVLESDQYQAGIIIKNSGVYLPSDMDLILTKGNQMNEILIPFVKHQWLLKPLNVINTNNFIRHPDRTIDLSTLADGTGNIASLQIENEVTYIATGNATITINNFDKSKIKGKGNIYFTLESGSDTAFIKIKQTVNVDVPGGVEYVINKANSRNNALVTFTNANRWSVFRLSL
jgi:hypothetical protein